MMKSKPIKAAYRLKYLLFSGIKHLFKGKTWLGSQRLLWGMFYVLYLVGVIVINLPYSITTMPRGFVAAQVLLLIGFVINAGCYARKTIRLIIAVGVMAVSYQCLLGYLMIYAAIYMPPHYEVVVITGAVLLGCNVGSSIMLYDQTLLYLLSAISFIAGTLCTVLGHGKDIPYLYMLFLVFWLSILLMGILTNHNFKLMYKENEELKREEAEFLQIFRMNKADVSALIRMSSEYISEQEIERALEMMNVKRRQKLIDNISQYIVNKELSLIDLGDTFPELTPTEKDICRLILQGKKIGEICILLNKTETNISTMRSHIRKKLNLTPSDNLLDALKAKISPTI